MRGPDDLRRAFDSVGASPVDTDGMLAGIRTRIAARRSRRRRATIVSVAAVTGLIALTPVVVSSFDTETDPPVAGPVGSSPPVTLDQPSTSETLQPTGLAFTVGELPQGYAEVGVRTEYGYQASQYASLDSNPQSQLDVQFYDPELSGRPAPSTTGETLAVESVTAGPLDVQVITTRADNPLVQFGAAWQTDTGLWLTITSNAPGDLARQEALSVAAQVDLTARQPLTFPIQLGYVPAGFQPIGASRSVDTEEPAGLQTSLQLDDRPGVAYEDTAWQIYAGSRPSRSEYPMANTTVGPYQAELSEGGDGRRDLTLFDVDGFVINISVNPDYADVIDEAEMRRIAESVVVIPGAADDVTVWTDQPLG